MVSVLANKLINKFLGTYIESRDSKQRKLDGDGTLNDLIIKKSALKDLPIQLIYGKIGKLSVNLKSLKRLDVIVEGIYIVVEPNPHVEYNEEKENLKLQTEKQNQLMRIEFDKTKQNIVKKWKDDATEKLTTSILGMLQIKVENMHVRYEDKTTIPSSPIAMGITLSQLHVESYDEKFKSTIPPDEKKLPRIYKMLTVHALLMYWNCNSNLYRDLRDDKLIDLLQQDIGTQHSTPPHYTYILALIHSAIKLKLNPRPEQDKNPFVTPRVTTNWEIRHITISLSQQQYRDIIGFADSMAFIARRAPFRKFRPNVPYKGHYKKWWDFAYDCILESEVRRRFNNFNWDHISNHIKMCKEYGTLYKDKKQSKKFTTEDQEKFTQLEEALDLMNIVLVRQKIKVELKILEKDKQDISSKLSGLFKKDKKNLPEDTSFLASKFHAILTPEEKEDFYKALDYDEDITESSQPAHYVDFIIDVLLTKLVVKLYNNEHNILMTQFLTVTLNVQTRTSADAIAVRANINEVIVTGMKQPGYGGYKEPTLISCSPDDHGALCEVSFDINPLNSTCTYRFSAYIKPIKIIYNAFTINSIVDFFTIPSSSILQQLSDVATSTFNNVKLQSAAKLQYVIDNRSPIELQIDLKAPYVIIPYGGNYTETENVIAINLGHAMFFSIQAKKSTIKEKQQKFPQEELLRALMEESYDKFVLKFSDLQMLVVPGGEDWLNILKKSTKTNYHILYPLSLMLEIDICSVDFDPRLPKCKISGSLPSLSFSITDFQLLLTLGLINSIPFPKIGEISPISESKGLQLRRPSFQRIQDLNSSFEEAQAAIESTKETKDVVRHPQHSSLEVRFTISEFCVNFKHQEKSHSVVEDVAKISLESFSVIVKVQTYGQEVNVKLVNFIFNKYHNDDEVPIILTPTALIDDNIFEIQFLKVDKESPDFATIYESTETLLIIVIEVVKLKLHQEILLSFLQYAHDLQVQLEELFKSSIATQLKASSSSIKQVKRSISDITSQTRTPKKKSKAILYGPESPIILFKLVASLQEFQITLGSDFGDITTLTVNTVMAEVNLKEPYTHVSVILKNINVRDLSSETKYFQILKVLSDEVVNFNLFLYDKLVNTSQHEDIAVSLSVGQIQIIFLNLYVSKVVAFINKFTQAKEAIIGVSKAAADKAKQKVANIYENEMQMSINVDLKSPQIIIPERSNSLYAVMCELGHLTIQSNFVDLNIINENSGSNAILDEIKLELSDILITRIESNQQLAVIHSTFLLQPVNFGLKLNRNLSSSWYKSVPDIQIKGHIDTIEIILRQADYGTVMAIFLGNLSEVVQEPVTETKPPSPENKPIQEILPVEAMQIQPETENKEVTIFVKLSFFLNKFTLRLLSTDDVQKSRSFKAARTNLAMFTLDDLCVKGRMMSDGAIHASVVLIDCVIEDTRIGKEDTLNKMFSKVYHADGDTASTSYDSMFDVIFRHNKEQTYLDLKITGFHLILAIEFLKTLQTFLMSAFSEENIGGFPSGVSSPQKVSSNKYATPGDVDSIPIQNATINIKLEKSDIVLVEHLNNINANAVIVNFDLVLKFRICVNRIVINGLVKEIQMYTCCYNPVKREETKRVVVFPVTVNIAGCTPQGRGIHIEICITEIRVKITPATIQLLDRVDSAMLTVIEQYTKIEDDAINLIDLWDPKPYNKKEYWFFKTNNIETAIKNVASGLNPIPLSDRKKYEMCVIRLPLVIVTVEIGQGKATHPVLMLEASVEGNVYDWSTDMVVDASMSLQMAYYNSHFAVWEPLIEPVGVFYDNVTVYNPWELKLDIYMNNDGSDVTSSQYDSDSEELAIISNQPKVSVVFSSKTNLEVTITKTTLEVLMNMIQDFSNAVNLTTLKLPRRDTPPYKIINRSGLKVKIDCEKSKFHVYQQIEVKEIILESGDDVGLQLKHNDKSDYSLNEILENLNIIEKHLRITVIDMQCEIELNLTRYDTRYFSLNYRNNRDIWGIVVSTLFEENTSLVIIGSIVKISNHLHLPVDVYYTTSNEQKVECIGSINSEETFYVPVNAVYSPTNELFFSIQKYSVTSQPFVWKYLYLKANQIQILQCLPTKFLGHSEPFVIKTISSSEQIYNENTVKRTMNSILCNVHIHPALLFRNCLPYNIYLTVQNMNDEYLIEPGCTLPITNAIPGVSYIILRLPNYVDKEWTCVQDILVNPPLFSVWTFDCYDSSLNVCLDLGVHSVEDQGPLLMTLYCPFWMLNKSELNIAYRNSDENLSIIYHPVNFIGPILFSFNAKNFFGKKITAIKIETSGEWSDKFSLDVAGSSGVIICNYDNKIYQFGVNIELVCNGLTKQVTFTPYYVLINYSPFPLECREHDRSADPWTEVQPHSSTAFWPAGDFDDKLLRMRIIGTKEVSPPFYFSDSHNTVLKLVNKYGGIYVDVQITESAVYITFAKYEAGMATALIINNTKNTLNIWEKDTVQLLKLNPGHKMFYSWSHPSRSRVICWEAGYKKEIQDDLRKDGCGHYDIAKNNHVYWSSFLDETQRTLLFTCNPEVARNARCTQSFQKINQEVIFSLFGLGLSFVNNSLKREIMYIAIGNSGVIWETCKYGSHRYKQMRSKKSAAMESSYKQYLCMKYAGGKQGKMMIDKMDVNFDTLQMLKPRLRKIRRTFLNGLWIQMTTNPYMLQIHAKINRIQIDNQDYDCMFPVVLAPVSQPKSVAGTNIHKPFIELSIVQIFVKHSQVKQFKYFKLLIQEFHVNLELGFVMALTEMFQTSSDTLEKQKASFLLDTELIKKPLHQHVCQQSLQEQKSFYDVLHFSPLKIHVSFSLGTECIGIGPNVVTVLLQSLGVTLTDMQDVVFRIAYFEREYTFLTRKQLLSEAISHYIHQAVKQLCALVLGLDVLGNPYGLVLGITKGVEDLFYEPYQGAIQGPGEFVEGLALGVRSLFGHAVGGTAGAVSRITGALGKGIAVLTFDKEFQRKRKDALKRKASVSAKFARSGKGLVMGVYHGVTGIIKKPISGAKEQGIGGFFKGLGKGAVGLVARPTSGVIDFASNSLDTVQRVTGLTTQEINKRLRPRRYIHADGFIRPYNETEANGSKILFELDKGKFARTDLYLYHFVITSKKQILLLTDQRLLYIVYSDVFGSWQTELSYTWNEIVMPPKVVPKGVLVMSTEPKNKKNVFSGEELGKTIPINDSSISEVICLKIITVHNTYNS